eukprot:CAMPEP_0181299198 /NCGR_PEP_ID=MMETSP1101-20121128/6210_1 /TAXON_ID=46948 /ORGANISM="Rhodomonas abbreviata, Strain Caron Lab Isolate" /LENGTH=67 /DNA_ID=CAMNT_0023404315 /DNA_START=553 /DNA_END=756 /DNA_ORIENTATION=+
MPNVQSEQHPDCSKKCHWMNHFDMMANHLVATFTETGIPDDIIQDVAKLVMPLREVFKTEAEKARNS